MTELEWMSLIGFLLLASCGIPGAVGALRHGCSVSWLFLSAWAIGALLVIPLAYEMSNWPMLANYTISAMCATIMLAKNRL